MAIVVPYGGENVNAVDIAHLYNIMNNGFIWISYWLEKKI